MRTSGEGRLSKVSTGINDSSYLHYRSLFRDIEAAVRAHAKGRVLDIGCGNKPYQPFFKDNTTSYTGVDIAQSSKQRVDVVCPCTKIPLPDGSFDTVFSTQVLEHIEDPQKMLNESFRLLSPGGVIILTAPMHWSHHEEPYDFYRYTRFGLNHMLSTAGFRDIEVKANGGKWALVGIALLSSLHSSLYLKKTPLRKFMRFFFSFFKVKWMINGFFAMLDDLDPDSKSTLNHLAVARR